MFNILKKYSKEILILLMSIILALMFFYIVFIDRLGYSSFGSETDFNAENMSESLDTDISAKFSDKYFYNQLTSDEQKEFQNVYCQVKNFSTEVSVNNISPDLMNKFIRILCFDCPELFYLSESGHSYKQEQGAVISYRPSYLCSEDEALVRMGEITRVLSLIMRDIENANEQSAEKYIHDYLISNIVYNQNTENCRNIYGALVEGKANCRGYSTAFSYLCRSAGIETAEVVGYANTSDNKKVAHSWNVVKIGNYYYYTDVCWDDYDEKISKTIGIQGCYVFYNLPTLMMKASHDPTETVTTIGALPSDNDESLIFYKQTGQMVDDEGELSTSVSRQLRRVSEKETSIILVQCPDNKIYDYACENVVKMVIDISEEKGYDFSGCKFVELGGNALLLYDFR